MRDIEPLPAKQKVVTAIGRHEIDAPGGVIAASDGTKKNSQKAQHS